jgi:Tol biopolymer transport system component
MDGFTRVAVSPDGKWIAYRSTETGRSEFYVEPFTGSAARGKWLISTGGGHEPQLRGDGKELFYATLQNPAHIMAVDIEERNGARFPGFRASCSKRGSLPAGGIAGW